MRKQKGAQSIMPAGTGAAARTAHAGPICGFADQQEGDFVVVAGGCAASTITG